MGRQMQVMDGKELGGMRIEYVKRREVLRLSGTAMADGVPVEIPLSQLIERLDVDPATLGVPVRYLLFGGLHWDARGGSRDLSGVYTCETTARQAFVELRKRRSDREGWAELAALDGKGRLTTLSWFGLEREGSKRDVGRLPAPGPRRDGSQAGAVQQQGPSFWRSLRRRRR